MVALFWGRVEESVIPIREMSLVVAFFWVGGRKKMQLNRENVMEVASFAAVQWGGGRYSQVKITMDT